MKNRMDWSIQKLVLGVCIALIALLLFGAQTLAGEREGCKASDDFAGWPVSLRTGKVYTNQVDFRVATGGIPFIFSRSYASDPHNEKQHSRVGLHWRHSYQNYLKINTTNNEYVFMLFGGQHVKFEQSGSVYKPKLGSGGYALTKSGPLWIVEAPIGMKYFFDEVKKRIVRQEDRRGNSLVFDYFVGPPDNQGKPRLVLRSVKSFLYNGTPNGIAIPKILLFEYRRVDQTQPASVTEYQSSEYGGQIVLYRVYLAKDDTTQCSNPQSSPCWNIGLLPSFSDVEASLLVQFHYQTYPSNNASYSANQLTHTLSTVLHKRRADGYMATSSDSDSFFTQYTYKEAPFNQSNKVYLLTKASRGKHGADQAILEQHTDVNYVSYQDKNGNTHYRSRDSKGPDGILNFTYTVNQPNPTNASVEDVNVHDTSVCIPVDSQNACYSADFMSTDGIAKTITGNVVQGSRNYETADDNSATTLSHGYRLPRYQVVDKNYSQTGGTNPIRYSYTFQSRGLESRTIIFRDDSVQGVSQKKYSVKEYYHKDLPGLLVALERPDSRLGTTKGTDFSLVINDYDPPSSWQCDPTSSNCSRSDFNKNPSRLVHRIVRIGYTNQIANNTQNTVNWVKQTQVTFVEYDSHNRPIRLFDPNSKEDRRLVYYGSISGAHALNSHMLHKIQVLKNATGQIFETVLENYDMYGNARRITSPGGSTLEIEYNSVGQVSQVKRDLRATSSAASKWAISKYRYNKAGLLYEKETPLGHLYKYEYETYGRLKKVSFRGSGTSVDEGLVEYSYDNAGHVKEVTNLRQKDANGQFLKTTYTYGMGSASLYPYMNVGTFANNLKIVSRTLPPPTTTTLSWMKYRDGRLLNGYFGSLGSNEGKLSVNYRLDYAPYNVHSIAMEAKEPNSNITKTRKTHFHSDFMGRLTAIVASNGKAESYVLDDFGRVIKKTVHKSNGTSSISQGTLGPEHIVRLYEYDKSNRAIKASIPDHQLSGGQRKVVTMEYDSLNRLTKVLYPAPAGANPGGLLTENNLTFAYDETAHTSFAFGKLTTVTVDLYQTSSGKVQRTSHFKYDAAGRILQKTDHVIINGTSTPFVTAFLYDDEGRRTSLIYPLLNLMYNYHYNAIGQLERVVDVHAGYVDVLRHTYNGLGGPLVRTDYLSGDTVVARRSRTSSSSGGRVLVPLAGGTQGNILRIGTGVTGSDATKNNLQDYLISFDKYGRLKGITDTQVSPAQSVLSMSLSTWGEMYNLTDSRGQVSRSYVLNYDCSANQTTNSQGASVWPGGGEGNLCALIDTTPSAPSVWSYHYDFGTNQLRERSNGTGSLAQYYEYGKSGERRKSPHRIYHYHTNGRLAIVEPKNQGASGNNQTVMFAYDSMGRRIRKMILDGNNQIVNTSLYFYDLDGRLLQEYKLSNQSESLVRSWRWSGGMLVGREQSRFNSSGSLVSDTSLHYIVNYMGTPTYVVDDMGRVAWFANANLFGKGEGNSLEHTTNNHAFVESSATYEELNYTNSSSYHLQNVGPVLKTKRYAIQLYFDKLDLELGYDYLIYGFGLVSGQDFQVLHAFSGNHQTGLDGNDATEGFWGPVIWVDPSKVPQGVGATASELLRTSDSSITAGGFRITKYRSWKVASGEFRKHWVNVSLPRSNGMYANNLNWSHSFVQSGAKWMRACFSGFDLEHKHDRVEIRNSQEHIVLVYTGNRGSFCTGWLEGSELKVRMYSDGSVQNYGFDIDYIESAHGVSVQASFPGHWKESETKIKDENGATLYAGLHYNWNRFYDPEVGQYIRRDPLGARAGQNAYTYANNDTLNYRDTNGLYATTADTTAFVSPATLREAGLVAARRSVGLLLRSAMKPRRSIAGAACRPGSILGIEVPFDRGLETATGSADMVDFGYTPPNPPRNVETAKFFEFLYETLMQMFPCMVLDSAGSLAAHMGADTVSHGFHLASLLCSFAPNGTGPNPKGPTVLQMSGSRNKSVNHLILDKSKSNLKCGRNNMIHDGDIPKFIPGSWTRSDMAEMASYLRDSIKNRQDLLVAKGQEIRHAQRLQDELNLLKQIEKKLSSLRSP